MGNQTPSFCWIRLLPKADVDNTLLNGFDVAYKINSRYRYHGSRPPTVLSQAPRGGNATYWTASPLFTGDPDSATVFDLGRAFASEAEATGWIEGSEGLQWVEEASDYFLLSVWPDTAFTALPPKTVSAQTEPGKFPDSEWMQRFRYLDSSQPEVDLMKPRDVVLGPYPHPEQDCADMAALAKSREDKELIKKIAGQAQSVMHGLQPVFDVLGIKLSRPPAPEAAYLVDLVQQNITRIVFKLKTEYNRDRPWNTCKGVKPLWEKRKQHRLYPGHASYPSSHATTAYTWAYYLAEHFKTNRDALIEAARGVAENREIAGVHFPSDSEAGRKLGQQMADLIIKAEKAGRIDLRALRQLAKKKATAQ